MTNLARNATITSMDTRNVLAKLSSSRAFVFAMLILALVFALVALGKAPYSEFIATAKWIGCVFIAGKSAEGIFANGSVGDPTALEKLTTAIRDSLSPKGPST